MDPYKKELGPNGTQNAPGGRFVWPFPSKKGGPLFLRGANMLKVYMLNLSPQACHCARPAASTPPPHPAPFGHQRIPLDPLRSLTERRHLDCAEPTALEVARGVDLPVGVLHVAVEHHDLAVLGQPFHVECPLLNPFVLEVLAQHRRTLPCCWGPRRRRSSWLAGPPLPALGRLR